MPKGVYIRTKVPISERFWKYVLIVNDAHSCWPWQGASDEHGYGYFGVDGKTVAAHRVAYLLSRGVLPPEMDVLHTCDYPPCERPDHLFLGTQQDNVQDMINKDRQAKGEDLPQSKLNDESALIVRSLYRGGGFSQQLLADMFGVNQSTIQRLLTDQTWKHLILQHTP